MDTSNDPWWQSFAASASDFAAGANDFVTALTPAVTTVVKTVNQAKAVAAKAAGQVAAGNANAAIIKQRTTYSEMLKNPAVLFLGAVAIFLVIKK